MKNRIKVLELSEMDEYYIKVSVNNQEVEAMIGYAPFHIKEGEYYDVEFSFTNIDDCQLVPSSASKKLIRNSLYYSYEVEGYLIRSNTVDAGILITSDFLEGNEHLVGKYVKFIMDRLEINFE